MDLSFTTTRDVTVADMDAAVNLLCRKGFPAAFLRRAEGGIDLRDDESKGPDLRFRGSRVLHHHKHLHDMAKMDRKTVFISHAKGLEPFDPVNQFEVHFKDVTEIPPSPEALAALLHAKPHIIHTIQVCFNALPHVIQHENRTVMSSDEPWHVNLHVGFDYLKAYQKYTKPAHFDTEVMFQCFLCKDWKNQFRFDWAVREEGNDCKLTLMEATLWMYHLGNPSCCDCCMMTITRKRKRQWIE
jgi:hypothetical protein